MYNSRYIKDAFAGFCHQIFEKKSFSDQIMINEVLKSCKNMISADKKDNVKQEIKELVAVSYNVSQTYLLRTWNTMVRGF